MGIAQENIDQITKEASMLALLPPAEFKDAFDDRTTSLNHAYNDADSAQKEQIMAALVGLGADLSIDSYTQNWTLTNKDMYPDEALNRLEVAQYVYEVEEVIIDLDPRSLGDLGNEIYRISHNGLLQLTRAADEGIISFAWLNDYAAWLDVAMRTGAAGATTNPVLVKLAAEGNPVYYTRVLQGLKNDHQDYSDLELAIEMTVQVVAENCKRMMPVFKATNGKAGYISLQLDPRNANDANATFNDAKRIYQRMQEVLETDTPNMVFKVAGTQAGYEAAKLITTELGCGVNVTVNYTLPQQDVFGAMLEEGNAPFNYLTEMNGRFNKPVMQQMIAAGIDADKGIAQAAAPEASRVVVQKAYKLLYETGECEKSTLLLASMRGVGDVLDYLVAGGKHPIHYTVFPNIQAQFDGLVLNESQLRETLFDQVDKGDLAVLDTSELFRMGTVVGGYKIGEFEKLPCVINTLKEFSNAMEQMVGYCRQGYFQEK